jgi:hypothetical protein
MDEYTDEYGDPINPRKAGGRGTGYAPPGGQSPGPGGGFGGGFGGTGFFGASAPVSEAYGGRLRRKVVMGPNGPVPVSFSPMTSDTVPAMLTPGEGVLNTGAMAEPGMEDFLNGANQRGMQRMAEGGVVPGGGEDVRGLLMALLPVLLGIGEQPEVEPQGFAFGGMVPGQRGGFHTNRLPGNRLPGAQQPRSRPPFLGSPPTQIAPPGGLTAPTTIGPQDPWGDIPFAPGSPNAGDEAMQRMWKMLQQYGQFGSFSPEGSAALLDSLRTEATGNADALRRRAALNADVSGLDAGQRGSYAMQTDLNTQGDVANILSGAKRGQLEGQQKFGQEMLSKYSDAQIQLWLAQLAKWIGG